MALIPSFSRLCVGALALAAVAALAAAAAGLIAAGAPLCLGAAAALLLAAITAVTQDGGAVRTIAALAGEADHLRHRSGRDPLTGLLARPGFEAMLAALRDGPGGTLVVVLADLDGFAAINHQFGPATGDLILAEAATRLRAALPDAAALARIGDDEFGAIVRCDDGGLSADPGRSVAEALARPYAVGAQAVELTARVGMAVGDAADDDGHGLLRRAGLALREAGVAGAGTCRMFDDALDTGERHTSAIRAELGRSIAERRFTVHYQPLVDARTGAFAGAEALLRAPARTFDGVSPQTLVALAEAGGQIVELTDWTIETALGAIKRLDAPVAVNVSPLYFRHPDFVQRVIDRLLAIRVRPELLTLEVTEGVLIADLRAAQAALARLRDLGVQIYLDDFGTGFSSLSYLQHLRLDGLKLDKSFLQDVGDQRRTTQIIRSMIDVGHSLDMKVVMEGVESDSQARTLQLLGCDYLQGFEIGVPMPLAELEAFQRASHLADVAAAPMTGMARG